MTYSAPKSVSFAVEILGDKELSRLHDNAVNSTLNIFEKEYLVTKIHNSKTKTQIPTGNQKMLVALFKHDLSHNEDPQTHTHCPLINAVLDDKAKWRALDSRSSIYDNKMLLGMIYRSDLAYKIKQAGHEILVYGKSDGQAYFDLKGIDRKITKEFSLRSDDIKHHLGEGHHSAADKANAAIRTRQGTSDSLREQLRDKWESQIKHSVSLCQAFKRTLKSIQLLM